MKWKEKRQKEFNEKLDELNKKVIEELVEKEWVSATLTKEDDTPLNGKYMYELKNPVSEECISQWHELDKIMLRLQNLSGKKPIIVKIEPNEKPRFCYLKK